MQLQDVEITALYFHRKPNQERFESFPRQMVYDGKEYTFLETSMQYLVRTGQRLIRLFDVSDGTHDFRLRLENNRWTLVRSRW